MPREAYEPTQPAPSLTDIYYAGGDVLGTIFLFLNPFIAYGEELYHAWVDPIKEDKVRTEHEPSSYAQFMRDMARMAGNSVIIYGDGNRIGDLRDRNERKTNKYLSTHELPVNSGDPESYKETKDGIEIKFQPKNQQGG